MRFRLREGDIVRTREGYEGRVCGGPVYGEYLVDYVRRPMEWRNRLALTLVKPREEAEVERKTREAAERVERRMRDIRERELANRASEQRARTHKTMYIHHEGKVCELKAGALVRYQKEFGKDVYHMRYCDMEWVERGADFAVMYMTERAPNPIFAAYLNATTTLITTDAKAVTMMRGTEVAAKVSENASRVSIEHGSSKFILPSTEFSRLFTSEQERQRRLASSLAAKTPNPAHKPTPPLEWFDVIASKDYRYGIEEGDMVEVARDDEACGFVIRKNGMYYSIVGGAFVEYFERYDINDYARELNEVKQHEVDAALEGIYEGGAKVGAELYGYPPEEERESSRVKELEAQIEELKRQKHEEDYGTVAECYLWEIEYEVPHRWGNGKSERIAEILTTQHNMAEAGIAAEATAKDDGLDAVVTMIKYKRRIFRTK